MRIVGVEDVTRLQLVVIAQWHAHLRQLPRRVGTRQPPAPRHKPRAINPNRLFTHRSIQPSSFFQRVNITSRQSPSHPAIEFLQGRKAAPLIGHPLIPLPWQPPARYGSRLLITHVRSVQTDPLSIHTMPHVRFGGQPSMRSIGLRHGQHLLSLYHRQMPTFPKGSPSSGTTQEKNHQRPCPCSPHFISCQHRRHSAIDCIKRLLRLHQAVINLTHFAPRPFDDTLLIEPTA